MAALRKTRAGRLWPVAAALALLLLPVPAFPGPGGLSADVSFFASLADRSTGTEGCRRAAGFIRERFQSLGLSDVGSMRILVPLISFGEASITVSGRSAPIQFLDASSPSPPATGPSGISGPVIWAGSGKPADFNGKPVAGSIVLMDLDSGKNWQTAFDLKAAALIYVATGPSHRGLFEDKHETAPIRFPRFFLTREEAEAVFPGFRSAGGVLARATVKAQAAWREAPAENVFALIPGTDPEKKDELVVLEAFYDSSARVPGLAPGADESLSAATLLFMAESLAKNPPARPVLLLATAGHAQSLFGVREAVSALRARSKAFKEEEVRLKAMREQARRLERMAAETRLPALPEKPEDRALLFRALAGALSDGASPRPEAARRLLLKGELKGLSPEESLLVAGLLPIIGKRAAGDEAYASEHLAALKSAKAFRGIAEDRQVEAFVSLHLSSHGAGLGAMNYGFLYPMRERADRANAYAKVQEACCAAAGDAACGAPPFPAVRFFDTLRQSPERPWESWFLDHPPLGGEVAALAGYLGLTLTTVDDGRFLWGSPWDVPSDVDMKSAETQAGMALALLRGIAAAEEINCGETPKNGFSTLSGRVLAPGEGEVFTERGAAGMVLQVFQGQSQFFAMSDPSGRFCVKGLSDNTHSFLKAVVEGYGFDPESGEIKRALDKKQSGKDSYRVKMIRRDMETDLYAFPCRACDAAGGVSPRSLRYLNRADVFDAASDSPPLRFWYSRTDTLDSSAVSVLLPPGSRFSLTLSDTPLSPKLILDGPDGAGYPIDRRPRLAPLSLLAAGDVWAVTGPRARTLSRHGIRDERVERLSREGLADLGQARRDLAARRYDAFYRQATASLALGSRVYGHVSGLARDVLAGVLFYIALFIPFAYCAERLLFAYSDVRRRITAFFGVLLAVTGLVFAAHPAFSIAASPVVVILAFFLLALSLLVSGIIFARFEKETAAGRKPGETGIGRARAIAAALALGVANLRRRPVRTGLTLATLVILTFTVMSFTSVAGTGGVEPIPIADKAPRTGFLFKRAGGGDLSPEALGVLENALAGSSVPAPRGFLPGSDPSRPVRVPVSYGGRRAELRGMTGLDAREAAVSNLSRTLVAGTWFSPGDRKAVLVPESLAKALGLVPGATLLVWGEPFTVRGVFSGEAFDRAADLDGEPVTPVIFPNEAAVRLSEAEVAAAESGEDAAAVASRGRHIPAGEILVVPFPTLLSLGGKAKSLAARPASGAAFMDRAAALSERFALAIYAAPPAGGVFLMSSGDSLSVKGLPGVAVPILIAILIVGNTMVASVFERKREIAVYTSVGLAPTHVGFLFVAEALAFGVLAVVSGYLLAQGLAALFAGAGLWSAVTVNYSSVAAVGSMSLVMLVVLVSAAYPARLAVRIAVPDVRRSFRLPEASGNTVSVPLPFLLRPGEAESLSEHLRSFFAAHGQAGLGRFSTGGVRADEKRVRAVVWLSPYDLGVRQEVEVAFETAREDAGFLSLSLSLTRLSGEAGAFRRLNRSFVNEIRKAVLRWRSA